MVWIFLDSEVDIIEGEIILGMFMSVMSNKENNN